MRKGSLSWLYTAWLIVILLAVNGVKSVLSASTNATSTPKTTTASTVSSTSPKSTSTSPTSTSTTEASVAIPKVNITAINALNSTSLNVTWKTLSSANEIIAGYTVCYHTNSTVDCMDNKTVNGNTTDMTILNGLNQYTLYYVAVKAFSVSGDFGMLGPIINGRTDEDSPSKGPNITSITDVTSTSMKIAWEKLSLDDANGNIIMYEICYKASVNATDIDCKLSKSVNNSDTTEIVLDGLNEATTYNVAVKAATSQGFGDRGTIATNKTLEAKPSRGPNIASITNVTATSMKITWEKLSPDDANGNITKYEVCYKASLNSKGIDCNLTKPVDNGNTREVILDKLKEATTYNIAVKASTLLGFGGLGPVSTKKTLEAKPSKGPNITSISDVTATSVKIAWGKLSPDDANGNITNYEVCYKASLNSKDIDCNLTKPVDNGNTREVILDKLKEATTYNIAVRASTFLGFGDLGTIMTHKTLEAVPASGPNITDINAISSTSINVSWENVSADDANGIITHYFVCYQVQSQTSQSGICSVNKTVTGMNNRSTVLNDLNEFTMYRIAVRAATSKGAGSRGEIKTETTLEDKPAKGPNITSLSANSTAIKITWEKLKADDSNGFITKYEVCYQRGSKNPNCGTRKNITGVNSTMIYITGLMPNEMYRVAVRAFTKIGAGPLGHNETVKTNQSVPKTGVTVTNLLAVSSTVLQVSWKKLQNGTNGVITGYMVCYSQNLSLGVCENKKYVIGVDNTTFNLTALNEATLYYVAVKAGTKIGFGPNGTIVSNRTLEDEPARGPDITSITSKSPTSLSVTWKKLSSDDENGIITEYRVGYQIAGSSKKLYKVVGNNDLSTTLSGLEIYTSYVVSVEASTIIGFGPPGKNMTAQTEEDAPGIPRIKEVTSDLTTISVTWDAPLKPNGEIERYIVQLLRNHDGSKQTINTSKLSLKIENLNPGTNYTVSVSAFTVDKGPAASEQKRTSKSELDGVKPVFASVHDDKTQIGINLPSIRFQERSKIKYFNVIVKRWFNSDKKENLRAIPESNLTNFEDSSNGMRAYRAIFRRSYTPGMSIIVGEGVSSTARRKRRNDPQPQNAPLSENTEYAIFVRVFYDGNGQSFQSSDVVIKKTTEKDDGANIALIVIIVVVIIVALLVAIFGVLLLRRHKAQPSYDGMPLSTTVKPVIRYPIPIAEFRSHCERLGMNSGLGYQDEYENIRPNGQVSAETAKRQENVDKNRYNNIHAYDDTRVILSQLDGEEGSDYINANHIDGFERKNQFIAAQGALKNTIVDFWRMIWEQNVSSIVMLANPIEKGREKLAVYWPQDRAVKHGPFMIKLDGEVELADYVIRKMTLTQDDVKETRQITQFHYTVWPDHGVPLYTTSLQAFLTRIRKFVKDDNHPLVVHCSAGVGRTGTFIGIFAMLDMIEATKTVDIFNFVCQMRTQRTHMVQVESQYIFLHKAVLEAIECGDTEINAPDLRVKMIQFNRSDPENPDETMMTKQFKVLEKYTFIKSNNEEGKKSYNIEKNRNKDILPYEDTRVSLLKSPGVDGSDYINASSIDSYQVRGMYIATQFPLESTVNEFWRMMWEKKSNCVVMLADPEENPDLFKKYWTDKSNDAMLCGNLLVTLDSEEKTEEYVIRNFKLKKNEGGETRDISHFNFLSWTEDKVPKNTVGIRQIIGKMQEIQRQGGNNPIVVHCSDGSGRTGAFCALVTSLERVKQDHSFNLFQTIMLQRIQRPRMVASAEQYKFCFQAILDFLDSFDEYANFQDLRQ